MSIRDHAPLFALTSQFGHELILRDRAGKPTVLFFYAKNELPACTQLLLAFRDRLAEFQDLNTQVYGISLDSPAAHAEFAQKHEIPFVLLSDRDRRASRLYGVCFEQPNGDQSDHVDLIYTRTVFLLDRNLRIANIFAQSRLEDQIAPILQNIREFHGPQSPVYVPMQAPILLIPNVVSPEFCHELINVWQTQGHSDSGFMKRDGEKTVGYVDHNFKVREDHFVDDLKLKGRIDNLMNRRVFPEIKKAFDYEVTRREDYKIAGYDSSLGGFFRAHRDNTSGGTAHRKFAMTLNLNTEEYEGGYLRFPEYGDYQYRPGTGSAVIFSCSLLHEATDVIKGMRYALLCFFYGEQEAEARRAYESRTNNDYSKVIVKN